MKAKRLRIAGLVQGVGYRDWMVREARRLGVDGWVRNRGDGSVEAFVQGDVPAVRGVAAQLSSRPAGRLGLVDPRGSCGAGGGRGLSPDAHALLTEYLAPRALQRDIRVGHRHR